MNVRKGFIVLSAILLTLSFTSCGGGGGSSGDGDDDYEWGGMPQGYYVAEPYWEGDYIYTDAIYYYFFPEEKWDCSYAFFYENELLPSAVPGVFPDDKRYRIENDGLIHFKWTNDESVRFRPATIIEGVGFVQNDPFTKAIGSVTFTYRGDTPPNPSRTPVTESE